MDDDANEEALTSESDRPPVDLSREREVFVRHFFKKGVELTEGLLAENKTLRDELTQLQNENVRLRAQVASDDAIRDLLHTIQSLESEREKLITRSTALEESKKETQVRNVEVEQELHDLANLYIASTHLTSSLSVRGVVRHLKELLQQLVGAETFAIYLLREEKTAVAIAADNLVPTELDPVVFGEGVLGEALMSGLPRVSKETTEAGSLDAPLAVVPLLLRDQCLGLIAITSLFEQKEVWAAVDREFFKLLGSHAASALVAAVAYDDADADPLSLISSVHEKLNA